MNGGRDESRARFRHRSVWFDFGGVLTPPVAQTLAAFCADLEVPTEAFVSAVSEVARGCGVEDPMAPLDTPILSADQWRQRVERALWEEAGLQVELGDFARRWFAGRPVNASMLIYAHELRQRGLFVGMLSNMPASFEAHWPAIAPPQFFDELVLSCRAGSRKPEAGIFELAAACAGVGGEGCIVVDDLAQNCVGARAAGWDAVHFSTTAQAITEVESLLSG